MEDILFFPLRPPRQIREQERSPNPIFQLVGEIACYVVVSQVFFFIPTLVVHADKETSQTVCV